MVQEMEAARFDESPLDKETREELLSLKRAREAGLAQIKPKRKASLTNVCQLTFNVNRVKKNMEKSHCLKDFRVTPGAAVYASAVLEYMAAELLHVSGIKTKLSKKKIMKNRHIFLGIQEDKEFAEILPRNFTIIKESGGRPEIHPQLVMKKKSQSKLM